MAIAMEERMTDVRMTADAATAPPATAAYPRDLATTALILGVAGFVWFGWAQAGPPAGWSIPLGIGSAAGLAVALAGGVLSWRLRSGAAAMHDPRLRSGYWRVVAFEVIAIVLGVIALEAAGQTAYLPAWILLIVGVHFIPLARMFGTRGLRLAGMALIGVAAGAAAAGAASDIPPSAVAGAGGGLVCVACAASCMRPAYQRAFQRAAGPVAACPEGGSPASSGGLRS